MLLLCCCENQTPQQYNALLEYDQITQITESNQDVKFVDVRKSEAFAKGHIPDAINVWRPDFQSYNFQYSGMIAEKEKIEGLLTNMGIHSNDLIIIYDDTANVDAARLWWILKYYGHEKIALLNGGYAEWLRNIGEISTISSSPKLSKYTFKGSENNSIIASIQDVVDGTKKEAVVILDTRTNDEYSGKRKKKGATRAGKIPNSIHVDWVKSVNFEGNMKFKSTEELKNIFEQNGVTDDKAIIVYCHSGVRSAHTTFVLTELMGYKNVRNYDGSWTEWSFFEHLPVELDTLTSTIK
jgi:thiosulfate/3-mercaptopyruvate sulfurtransferase